MRRISILALALVLVGALAFMPAEAKKRVIPGSTIDSLETGTSAVNDTSISFDITGYSYIGLTAQISVVSGGGSGAGLFYVEGSTDAGIWDKVWVVDLGDTMSVKQDVAFSGTSSLQESIIISTAGFDYADGENASYMDRMEFGNYLPYEKLRVIVVDTNWNAYAYFSYDWIVEPSP